MTRTASATQPVITPTSASTPTASTTQSETPTVTATVGAVALLVCDVAPRGPDRSGDGDQLDAGEFGDGTIANLDVVTLFRASLLPNERPPSSSDMFSVMDAAGEDVPPLCGGDGRLANSDVVLCFRRSLLATLFSYERHPNSSGCTSSARTLHALTVARPTPAPFPTR